MSFLTDLPEKNTFVNLSQLRTTANIQTETDLGLKRRYKFTYTPKLTNKEYQTSYQFPKIAFVSQSERLFNQTSKDQMNSPGPGAYNNTYSINPTGRFINSKVENIHNVNFGADKSKRFVYTYNNNPGPADFNMKPLMGVIFDSRFRSNQGKSIYAKYKNVDSRSNYPGPGQYRAFSEFGIYESKNAQQKSEK